MKQPEAEKNKDNMSAYCAYPGQCTSFMSDDEMKTITEGFGELVTGLTGVVSRTKGMVVDACLGNGTRESEDATREVAELMSLFSRLGI